MRSLIFRRLLFVGVFLMALAPAHAQKKYDKYQANMMDAYGIGDYKKALKFADKLILKSREKLGSSNAYLPYAYISRAAIMNDNGELAEVDTTVKTGLDLGSRIFGETSPEYAYLLLQASQVMLDYGSVLRANGLLEQSLALTEDTPAYEELKVIYVRAQARVMMAQGYYTDALKFIEEELSGLQGLTAESRSYVDENGNLQTEKIDRDVRQANFREYARLLIIQGNVYRLQGDFIKADNAFIMAQNWIKDHLGRNDATMAECLYWQTLMLDENGAEGLPEQEYMKALRIASKDLDPAHKLFVDINEALLAHLIKVGENSKANSVERMFEKTARKYYGRMNYHYLRLAFVQLEGDYRNERFRNLEQNTIKLLRATTVVPLDHPARIQWFDFGHRVAIVNEDYPRAYDYLQRSLELKAEIYGTESPEYHMTRLDMAHFFLNYTDSLAEAEAIFEESYTQVVSKEITPGHVRFLDYMEDLAEIYEINDRYADANRILDVMADAARKKYSDTDIEYGRALKRIADLQIKIGQYAKSLSNLTTARVILEEFRDKDEIVYLAETHESLARLHIIYGKFDEAEELLDVADRLRSRAEVSVQSQGMESQEALAGVYLAMGDYSLTEDLLEDVFEYKRRVYGTSSRRLVVPLTIAARLALISGDYSQAEKGARRAYNLAVQSYGPNSTKITEPLSLLADIYITIGDYQKAEDRLQEIIQIQEREFGRDHLEVALSLTKLGRVKFSQEEDYAEIEALYLEAENTIQLRMGNGNPHFAEVLKHKAALYIAQEKLVQATEALEKAQGIWEQRLGRRNNINLADIYLLHGDVYYAQRKYSEAESLYNDAKRLFDRFFSDEHPEYVKTLSRLAKVYYMNGDQRAAKRTIEEVLTNYNQFIRDYFPALSEREKAKFWNTIKADYEFYNTLAVTMGDRFPELVENVYNNALLTKALLLSSSIKMRQRIVNSGDQELIARYEDWLTKKELLTTMLSMSQEDIVANQLNPAQVAGEVELLEKELSERSEAFAEGFDQEVVTWEEVRDALGPNEVAVEMVRFRYFDQQFTDSIIYAVLYVKPDFKKGPQLVLIPNGADLEGDYLHYYRNSIRYRLVDQYSYDIFWRPIDEAIGTTSTMYLSVDGVYNQINVEAIPTGENRYVIDNSNIILVSNTKDVYRHQQANTSEEPSQEAVMFGDPEFYVDASDYNPSGKISNLPGTREEVGQLQKLLAEQGWITEEYVEDAASEQQLKQLENPRVFHIATHGFFEPGKPTDNLPGVSVSDAEAYENPLLRTGLLLTGAGNLLDQTDFNFNLDDGILTAYEAMNLNLDNTDLVVLSACETGLGEIEIGEGVYGLQRAFLVAGAKTLIMSLFKVPDEATQKLMVKFYTKWLETGDKRQAFIEAKKEIRNEFQEPYYWGAFVMIGLE